MVLPRQNAFEIVSENYFMIKYMAFGQIFAFSLPTNFVCICIIGRYGIPMHSKLDGSLVAIAMKNWYQRKIVKHTDLP